MGKITWTQDMLRTLEEEYPTHTVEEMMELLPGKSAQAIKYKAWERGIKQHLSDLGVGACMAKLLPTELAYLAGIFDGEGSVRLDEQPNKPNGTGERKALGYTCHITISNTNPDLREWMAARLPSRFYKVKRDKPHWNECWNWVITGHPAVMALRALLPYLVIKKPLALAITRDYDHPDPTVREELLKRCIELRRRATGTRLEGLEYRIDRH